MSDETRSADQQGEQLPIINCHTHVFTGDYVPPLLAKGFLICPFYFLLSVRWVIGGARLFKPFFYPQDNDGNWIECLGFKQVAFRRSLNSIFNKYAIVPRILFGIQIWLGFYVLAILSLWIKGTDLQNGVSDWIRKSADWLWARNLLLPFPESPFLSVIIVIAVLMFAKQARRIVVFVWGFIKKIPGPLTTELLRKYWQLAEYAKYKHQYAIFNRLKDQYPPRSQFIVLPMDMKYMRAGKIRPVPEEAKPVNDRNEWKGKDPYLIQLSKLHRLKQNHKEEIHPFIFVDPRRLKDDRISANLGNERFFDFFLVDSKVELRKCLVNRYLKQEDQRFAGIKLYPALGYYPFDIELLPLLCYAADNGIPLMTHCIRGTIFYRGYKRVEWHRHPILRYKDERDSNKLLLPEVRARDYSVNFTHPMNFLCLLNEPLLREHIGGLLMELAKKKDTDSKKWIDILNQLFEFKDFNTRLKRDLSALKICIGHFGGEDQWQQYLHTDRDFRSGALTTHPYTGAVVTHKMKLRTVSWDIVETGWYETDWFSIISGMMLQYPNVYADISYILHDPVIYPQLRSVLNHQRGIISDTNIPLYFQEEGLPVHQLGERVLFGTDFYMVRSHRSERDILAQIRSFLSDQEFDQIARVNPRNFLASRNYQLKV